MRQLKTISYFNNLENVVLYLFQFITTFFICFNLALVFQYEPEILDVTEVCFKEELDIPNAHEKSRKN